jgi:hypothetical protein
LIGQLVCLANCEPRCGGTRKSRCKCVYYISLKRD